MTIVLQCKNLLMELGVPEDAIILQSKASNLREDVSRSLEMIQDKEIKSVILVTSALKMDRTLFLLRDSDLTITPHPPITRSRWTTGRT